MPPVNRQRFWGQTDRQRKSRKATAGADSNLVNRPNRPQDRLRLRLQVRRLLRPLANWFPWGTPVRSPRKVVDRRWIALLLSMEALVGNQNHQDRQSCDGRAFQVSNQLSGHANFLFACIEVTSVLSTTWRSPANRWSRCWEDAGDDVRD